MLLLARAGVPLSQAHDRLLDDGQRPLPFEDSLGREVVRRLEPVAPLRLVGVEGDGRHAASSLGGRFPRALVRKKVLQRREEEGAELSLGGVDGLNRLLLEQVNEEGLREILRGE